MVRGMVRGGPIARVVIRVISKVRINCRGCS